MEKGDGAVLSESGEGGIGIGESEQGDFGISDGESESVLGRFAWEGKSELAQKGVEWFGTADLVEHAHRGDIERACEGLADGDGSMVAAVIIFGSVQPFLGLVVGRDIRDDGAGVEALFFKGEGVGERLEGRAGGARSEGSVDLSALATGEVRGAVEGEDFAGGIFDDDDGPMPNVFLAEFSDFFGEDEVGFLLKVGVNAQAGTV